MEIRKARKEDLEDVCRLGLMLLKHHSGFRRYYSVISDSKKRKGIQMRYFTKELKKRNSLFLVLSGGGRILGYSIAKIEKNPPLLKEKRYGSFAEVFIEEAFRGRGFGTKLARMSKEWLKTRGIARMAVDFDASNQEAEKYYRRMGFVPFQNRYEKHIR
jgi:ribosomal protein S18 acetylase RimI-like enzyme